MLACVVAAALGHTPHVSFDRYHALPAEPSAALYSRGPASILVGYADGDFMYASVLEPVRVGIQLDAELGTVTATHECTGASVAATDSHAKNHTPGDTMYEGFGESELKAVATVVTDRRSSGAQTCLYTISADADAPYVFVVGTKEEIGGLWATGLPVHVYAISRWLGNGAYWYAFAAFAAAAGAVLWRFGALELAPAVLAAVFSFAAAASRLSQVAVAGFGWGQAITLLHILFGTATLVAARKRSGLGLAALAVLSAAMPLRLYWVEPTLLLVAAIRSF
jgi:hypothetical protein